MSAAERGNNGKAQFLGYKDGIFKHLSIEGSTRRNDLSHKEISFGQVDAKKWVLRTCTMCEGLNHNKQMEMKRK